MAQGRLDQARAWARATSLAGGAAGELPYLREYDHLTVARLLIAETRASPGESTGQAALELLGHWLGAAEAGGRGGSVNEILMLQALAHASTGQPAQALAVLQRCLGQAEPEGYVRLFVDEGPPMAALLRRLKDEGGRLKGYVSQLLAAFGPPAAAQPSTATQQRLPEPLSEREVEVLKLLRTELSGPEIARELMVSPNTFHTHTKNIYSKLGVKNRQAAVIRADELRL
jgi:LuxR family maltose regulon positive regulatory protein